MNAQALLTWLLALAPVPDAHGLPIRRPRDVAEKMVKVALDVAARNEAVNPLVLTAALDVIGARESHYSTHPRGPNDHGRSKGFGQTPSGETPDDLEGQIRVSAKWLIYSMSHCERFPLSPYATGGGCHSVAIANEYWGLVRAELAVPMVADVVPALWVAP